MTFQFIKKFLGKTAKTAKLLEKKVEGKEEGIQNMKTKAGDIAQSVKDGIINTSKDSFHATKDALGDIADSSKDTIEKISSSIKK